MHVLLSSKMRSDTIHLELDGIFFCPWSKNYCCFLLLSLEPFLYSGYVELGWDWEAWLLLIIEPNLSLKHRCS